MVDSLAADLVIIVLINSMLTANVLNIRAQIRAINNGLLDLHT